MANQPRPPSLSLISTSSPARPISTSPSPLHRQSQSPFRYVHFDQSPDSLNEKGTPLTNIIGHTRRPSSFNTPTYHAAPSRAQPSSSHSHTFNNNTRHSRTHQSHTRISLHQGQAFDCAPTPLYTRPRGLRIFNPCGTWLPIILYILTSLIFVVGIALYKAELFSLLDELAHWLQIDEHDGHAVLFFLIFLTTFPPIPLYSTLIILSGYTFGPWTGAIISYFAALSGALTVFILSRTFFRECITGWLASTSTIKRVVRAIEKRPKLLFLIRLAPYPYNVMNCLLAASPTLTLRTYTICTALSLFKVFIHTSLGASIHSFKDYHLPHHDKSKSPDDDDADVVARMWTFGGIILCVAILIYLSVVARRAVDDELDDEAMTSADGEETLAFLSSNEVDDMETGRGREMSETPFRTHQLVPFGPSMSAGTGNGTNGRH